MLLELTIGNYRSFREDATLSLVSTKLKSRDPGLDEKTRHALSDDLSVLHTATIYGANASGKSNLIQALRFALSLIRNSAREGQAGDQIDVAPFMFHDDSRDEPTYFEIVFLREGIQYRYGFEVDREKVHREWLLQKRKRESNLLEREEQSIELHGALREGKIVASRTRPNALFLSVAAQFDVALAVDLLQWFRKIGVLGGLIDVTRAYTAKCVRDGTFGGRAKDLLRALDTGILDLRVEDREVKRKDLPRDFPDELANALMKRSLVDVDTAHPVYDDMGTEIGAGLDELGSGVRGNPEAVRARRAHPPDPRGRGDHRHR